MFDRGEFCLLAKILLKDKESIITIIKSDRKKTFR